MFKIGDKVSFSSDYTMTGYIVGINIDPIEESDVNFEKNNWVDYTIRVFKKFTQVVFLISVVQKMK